MVDHDMGRWQGADGSWCWIQEQVALDTPQNIFGNPDVMAHHIGAPDYVAITRELKERGLYDGPVKVIEEDTIELVRRCWPDETGIKGYEACISHRGRGVKGIDLVIEEMSQWPSSDRTGGKTTLVKHFNGILRPRPARY